MYYKRTEYFRFMFKEPLEAELRIIIDEAEGIETHRGPCHLIDLSPGGFKFFSEYDIPLGEKPVRLRLNFVLHEETIEVRGILVWKNPFKHGFMYGYEFDEDATMEKTIVEQLKLRRRSGSDSSHPKTEDERP